jgi:hypothetical protein
VDEHNGTIEVRTLDRDRLMPGDVRSGTEKVHSIVLRGFSFAASQIFAD